MPVADENFRAEKLKFLGKLRGVLQFVSNPPPAVDYRRSARKLRCRLAHDPGAMQWALGQLAKRADETAPKLPSHLPQLRRVMAEEPVAPIVEVNGGVRDFAQAVAAELNEPVLRYSRRQALLKQAGELGIGRFDANLIIAAVQHRMGSERPIANARPAAKFNWSLAGIVACVTLVQSLIVAGAVFVLR